MFVVSVQVGYGREFQMPTMDLLNLPWQSCRFTALIVITLLRLPLTLALAAPSNSLSLPSLSDPIATQQAVPHIKRQAICIALYGYTVCGDACCIPEEICLNPENSLCGDLISPEPPSPTTSVSRSSKSAPTYSIFTTRGTGNPSKSVTASSDDYNQVVNKNSTTTGIDSNPRITRPMSSVSLRPSGSSEIRTNTSRSTSEIIGVVVGGVVILCLTVGWAVICLRRRWRRQREIKNAMAGLLDSMEIPQLDSRSIMELPGDMIATDAVVGGWNTPKETKGLGRTLEASTPSGKLSEQVHTSEILHLSPVMGDRGHTANPANYSSPYLHIPEPGKNDDGRIGIWRKGGRGMVEENLSVAPPPG